MTLQPPQPSRHRNTDSGERNYHQIRVRQDINENWLKNNPIPASGEWCYSIGHRNPPPTYTLDNLPPATEELEGTFILVANEGENYVYECVAGLEGSGYVWRPRSIDYVEPEYEDQCVKIGDGNTHWSELAWLGGRGQTGQTGEKGPEGPQGVDGTGSIAYRTIEIVALDAQTEFILPVSVQATASFVTINGVVLSPSTYTLQVLKLTLATGIDTKAGDNVSIFTWIGAVDFEVLGLTTADVRTLGTRPDYVKAVAKDDIENQQEVNWFFFDAIDRLDAGGVSLNTSDILITSDDRPQKYEDLNLQNQQDVNWYLMDKIDDATPEEIELPDNLATTDDITAAIDGLATEDFVLDQDFITEQVVTDAIEGLASQAWVLDQGFITDVSSYATQDYVNSQDEAVQRFATSADSAVLATAKKYTDDSIPIIEARMSLKTICFNTQQGVGPSTSLSPPEGKATFVNSPEIGGRQNGNLYFGNCNSCINIAKDQITNNVNQEFVEGESYEVVGFVTVYGKEDHKLYLKAPVARIVRIGDYVKVGLSKNDFVPAICYGTGEINDQAKFIIVIEAFEMTASDGRRTALERLEK